MGEGVADFGHVDDVFNPLDFALTFAGQLFDLLFGRVFGQSSIG